MRGTIRRYAIVLAAWLPFFVIWTLFAMLYAHYPWRAALATSLDFDGERKSVGNRRLARLPTFALAASTRPEVLFAANPLRVSVLNSLERHRFFARVGSSRK